MQVISREEAKAAGLKRYYTGVPCQNGHDAERYTSNKICSACSDERNSQNATARKLAKGSKPKAVISEADYARKVQKIKRKHLSSYYERKKDVYKKRYDENKEEIRKKQSSYNKENKVVFKVAYYKSAADKLGAIMPDRSREDGMRERELIEHGICMIEGTGIKKPFIYAIPLKGVEIEGIVVYGPHVWWNMVVLDDGGSWELSPRESIEFALNRLYKDGEKFTYIRDIEKNLLSGARPKDWKLLSCKREKIAITFSLTKFRIQRAHIAGKRRARKMKATPSWLTEEHWTQIEKIYEEAKVKEIQTGLPHHVDHIVPLQGENVCGLHVPWNLRAITAEENLRKYNKIEEAAYG